MTNPMAQSWLDAADDLGIRVVHPFRFTTASGIAAETVGVFLPDFGCKDGMLLTCRFDPDELYELVDDTPYRTSGLSPRYYEPYSRRRFMQTLADWGWFGPEDQRPQWYDQDWRSKSG
ncbi:MAG: hypothetical protein SF187_20570 [Deltaproteobacteria bacterium]|nr:hypothetical protein [Deltaproteobacteria bacterium]